MALTQGTLLGPYEVLAPIGAGGMGEVYKARDTRLDRTVAVKVLPTHIAAREDIRQRFEREARVVSSLNHPHICTLFDIGRQDEIDYLVMEYLEGETLAQRLQKGPLPLEQALRYAVEMADALDQAHRREVVHPDLKPGNIMLTATGAKLLDFGLAKMGARPAADGVTLTKALTTEGTVIGTFQYMAPEQLEGKDADARTDIFAFGAVIYEMVTGRPAFSGKSQASLMIAILEGDPPALSTLHPLTPAALDRLVSDCLAKNPDDRWQSARDLLRDLKRITPGTGSSPGRPEAGLQAGGLRHRGHIAWAAAALLLFAIGWGAAYWQWKPEPARAIRFQIHPPEKEVFWGFPVISPDGRKMALRVRGADGKFTLRIRALDSLPAQVLPDSVGAVSPFWSPDSRFLGFFADGKLKKIDVTGGPPQTLCEAIFPGPTSTGTWNREGVILFSARGGLHRVPAAGGVPVAVTAVDAAKQEGPHSQPHFLPDGRRFLYQVGGSPEAAGVYAGDVDARPEAQRRKLVRRGRGGGYFWARSGSDGYLMYNQDSTLMALPFDAKSLQPKGDPIPVATELGAPFGLPMSVSATGVLAYITGSAIRDTQLAWFDRGGKQIATAGAPAPYQSPALSPDEKRLAVSRSEGGGGGAADLWLLDLVRGIPTRFTFDPGYDGYPVWSPDGSRIAFAAVRGTGSPRLYQKISSGAGSDEPLLKSSSVNLPTSWSRDGRLILFDQQDPKTKYDIWALPVAGDGKPEDRKPYPVLRTDFEEHQGQFSPDGRWIAYVSDESSTQQVYVQTFPPSGGKWQVSTAGGVMPLWSRDGKELFYLALDRKIMAAPVKMGTTFEAGVAQPLFEARITGAGPFGYAYAVSADGRRFLVNTTLADNTPQAVTVVVNWTAALK